MRTATQEMPNQGSLQGTSPRKLESTHQRLKKTEPVVAVAASRRFYGMVRAMLVGSPSCAISMELGGLARESSAAVSARSEYQTRLQNESFFFRTMQENCMYIY